MQIRIGTRGSPLALVQARQVAQRLEALARGYRAEIVVIRTTGDRVRDRPLSEIGGKGLFTKEIEEALHERRIDAAVHSMKDVETWLPDGLAIVAMLPREDPRDAFIARDCPNIDALAPGAVVGTASLRRQAQILHRRPDLRVVPFRGNVETRLAKLRAGEVDATLLAMAGLNRLGMASAATTPLTKADMLPAVGQGAVGVEVRADNNAVREAVGALDDPTTATAVAAERAMLARLDGSCRTPIAALAEVAPDGALSLEGLVASPDGRRLFRTHRHGAASEAQALGADAGAELRAALGPGGFG